MTDEVISIVYPETFRHEEHSSLQDETLLSLSKSGDMHAEEILVMRFTPMVYAFTRSCYRDGWERADFVQEGFLGLLKAIRNYNPTKNVKFSDFAAVCIRNELHSALRKALNFKNLPLNDYLSLSNNKGEDTYQILPDFYQSDPIESLVTKDTYQRLLAKLYTSLSTFEKKVLSAWMNGFLQRETALALDKPQKSIDNAMTRIKRKAAEILQSNTKDT